MPKKVAKKENMKKETVSKKMEKELLKAEEEVEEMDEEMNGSGSDAGMDEDSIQIKASKPVGQIKKGDRVVIDGKALEVDSHYVLIDHGSTKEMAIELFDPKTDKDYQIRYFSDQIERTLQCYELHEIIYNIMRVKKVEW